MATATETPTERQVREEQEAHEAEIAADAEAHDEPEARDEGKQGALLDRSQYQREDLALQRVDGNDVDRISLKFSGTVFLDRSQPADVALYRKLSLGRDVTLVVEGRCNSTGAAGATDREGDLDVVVGHKGVKVHTVYLSIEDGVASGEEQPAGQGLEEAAAA